MDTLTQVKYATRRNKREYSDSFAQQAQEAVQKYKTLYKLAKQLTMSRLAVDKPLNDGNGNLLLSPEVQTNKSVQHI